jgi:hypothetical protein
MATMRSVGGAPLIPVEEIDYVYDVPIKSFQAWSIDIPLGQNVDPSRHVALLHCNGGFFYSDSGNNYQLGYFVEIIDSETVRLTIQGANNYYVRTNTHLSIGIYKFGVKPKHAEAAFYNHVSNGAPGTLTLSKAYDLKRTVLLNAGGTNIWQGYIKWQDAQTLYCVNRHCGAFVAEF